MSSSLFLDPFQDPHAAPGPGAVSAGGEPPGVPPTAAETVPGTVVDSGAAADRADRAVAVLTPLDIVDAAGAFLDDAHLWWPRAVKATDPEGHVYFGQGQLLEEGTEGEIHRWATVVGASETTLELDWLGRAPAVAGASSVPAEGGRVFLSWTAGESAGTELRVRGSEAARWLGEWTAILTAYGRFTGGRMLDEAGGSPDGTGREGNGGRS
ncbi:hypothetical protein AB0K08_14830 [Citricoccus sp. NPDC055426]|uniref:hypothetical protein n=1 Tax=Citricoccus sp. NPDC055426 TaxID=3155536 RepID=UPI0034281B5C